MADKTPIPELATAIKAAEAKYKDLPPGLLEQFAGVESEGGRKLVNPNSSARGPFQFMEKTGPEFGLMTEADRMDIAKSTDAAARLLLRNKKDLEQRLGRPVTGGELYLAHQQGAAGAARLLADPNARAVDVVGADQVRLNLPKSQQGLADTITTGDFAKLWTGKFDGGGGTAPAKKSAPASAPAGRGSTSIGQLTGLSVPSEASFYQFDPNSIGQLQREAQALDSSELSNLPVEDVKVPVEKIGDLTQLIRAKPATQAEPDAVEPPTAKEKTNTAILQGLTVAQKTAQRLAEPFSQIAPVDDTVAAPSGIAGEFSKGIESGLQNINADYQYFGAIIDTLTGNEAGKSSRLFNADQFQQDSAKALAGMQSFEEFLKEPSFGGFLTQVVSSTGQVAPSALEAISSALLTGGMWTLVKQGLSVGTKAVAKTLVKDLIKKKAKGEALDAAEDSILEGLYKNFKQGAIAGAFGSEYRMMAGEAFSEFKDAGVDLNAERAFQSLMIGVPQAAIGVGGEAAILETIGKLALKKSTRVAGDSVLKRFAADVFRTAAKSGAIEGTTEAAQETISAIQRASVDPTFTMEDAQLRIGQAAFAGFFGGGSFGGLAGAPAAALSNVNMKTIQDKAKSLLKDASEARVEAEVDNETKNVSDAGLSGATSPEDLNSLQAQMDLMLQENSPKKAVWVSDENDEIPTDVEPGKVKAYDLGEEAGEHAGKRIYVGHVPGRGKIISVDPEIVDSVMSEYELNGDVDAATGAAMGYAGGKDGDNVVRVKDAQGNVLSEQVASEDNLAAARARASEIANAVEGATVDEPTIDTALEERAAKHLGDKRETVNEAAAAFAVKDFFEGADPTTIDPSTTDETGIEILAEHYGLMPYRRSSYPIGDLGPVGSLSDADIAIDIRDTELALAEEKRAAEPQHDNIFLMEQDLRALKHEQKLRADEVKQKSMVLDKSKDPRRPVTEKTVEEPASTKLAKRLGSVLSRKDFDDALDEAVNDPSVKDYDMAVAFSDLFPEIKSDRKGRSKEQLASDFRMVAEVLGQDEVKQRSMVLDDEGENVDDGNSESDVKDIETQLDEQYAALDEKNATKIEQYKERTKKESPEAEAKYQAQVDDLWLRLAQYVPDEQQYEAYKKFKDRMPINMLKKLIELNRINDDELGSSFYDVAEDGEGVLSVTERNPFPDSETTVTREAVRDVLKQVAKFPGDFENGTMHIRGNKAVPARASMFWLVNRRTGKAMRLNGTPAKKGKTSGRPGLQVLAQAGVVLNARTDQAMRGEKFTEAQKNSQGLITMLKALVDGGYDLKVGKYPSALVEFNQNKLDPIAQNELAMIIGTKPYSINDLLDVKPPFESSKSDFDASDIREELSNTKERVTPSVTVRGRSSVTESNGNGKLIAAPEEGAVRTEERAAKTVEAQGPEQFAEQEDKKKRINDDERDASAKERNKRNAEIDAIVKEAVERDHSGMIEASLDPVPADVTIQVKKVGNKWRGIVSSPRFSPKQTVLTRDEEWAYARAHALALKQGDVNPTQYNRLALETTDSTVDAREQHPEILGVPAEKSQSSILSEAKPTQSTNKITLLGNVGKLTGRIMNVATQSFNFHKPLTVVTLSHLKQNFDALTADGAKFARLRDTLADVIDQMDDPARDEPGRVLMGRQYMIILRDEPLSRLDTDGNDVLAPDDAKIGAVLAHEIGHLVFEQEFDRMIDGTPLKKALWQAYLKSKAALAAERGQEPGQYTNDKAGFEEWYADQVMAFVYNEARQAKGIVEGYFKRLAKALFEFFNRVNEALGGRLKLSRENISSLKRTVTDEKGRTQTKNGGTFADYMDQVVARNKEERKLNNTFPVEDTIKIRSMVQNVQGRTNQNQISQMQKQMQSIMKSGRWGEVTRGLMNIVQASQDFMNRAEHGEGGHNLARFFGTYSQSQDAMGWNKRELFSQNRLNNRLANIFGFNDRTSPKEWDSQRTRAIMIEAMDEDKSYDQLSTPEAKAIRDLYKDIEQNYLKVPGTAKKYYVPDFTPRPNYGGSMMWNVDKIAKNKDAFISWITPRLKQHGDVAKRANNIWESITRHTNDQTQMIINRVDVDDQNAQANGKKPMTPVEKATARFILSMQENAITEVRDKTLRDARRGAYDIRDVTAELIRAYPGNVDLGVLITKPVDEQYAGLKKFWLEHTRQIRLTPGMDPALQRKLAPEIKHRDAYEADPNDPNGWLLPPALAHSQYMHYAARRVEFEKMGGVKHVINELNKIPEEYRAQVDEAIMANLGKFGENMSNGWRALNSVAAVWTVFTTLLFTTLSSVTDLAGIATRSKDFNSLGTYINAMRKTLTEREFQELARSVGVVTGRTQEHMMIGQGELDYANKSARSVMNAFFRYTGLEFYTKFTRSLATGMGREFIINTANKEQFADREKRYLSELGLTREDVQKWMADNQSFETPHGEKVRNAIARFADEAVIRPDASQRPTWASNPYLQTVWQLKSYYYGFGKTVLGGLGREIKNRYSEDGNFEGAAASIMLYASTIIPLTMFGMASRDWMKWLFQLALPGVDETPFATSKLDGAGYLWEIVKRSGTLGPFALGVTTMEAFKFEGIAAPFTANVPMFDLFDDTMFDGDWTRALPVINNVK